MSARPGARVADLELELAPAQARARDPSGATAWSALTAASSPRGVAGERRAISIVDRSAASEFGQKRSSRERCQAAASRRPARERLREAVAHDLLRARPESARARSAAVGERAAAADIGDERLRRVAGFLLRPAQDERERQAVAGGELRERPQGLVAASRACDSDEQRLGAQGLRGQRGGSRASRRLAARRAAAASPERTSSR